MRSNETEPSPLGESRGAGCVGRALPSKQEAQREKPLLQAEVPHHLPRGGRATCRNQATNRIPNIYV